jgi:hypothetical protein
LTRTTSRLVDPHDHETSLDDRQESDHEIVDQRAGQSRRALPPRWAVVSTHTTRTPRLYSRSNATRFLSAGVYQDRSFRKGVISELMGNQFRVVPPSYGYDVVTVLAHALAARSLWRKQIAGLIAAWLVDIILLWIGVIGIPGAILLAIWAPWAFAFLRRAATLQALITRLRPSPSSIGEGEDTDFPANRALTAERAEEIAVEQAGGKDKIFYGGYSPFVGAGWALTEWSIAELLIPAKPHPFAEYLKRDATDEEEADEEATAETSAVKPFTVDEITEYVASRLRADLHDEAPYGEQIEHLTVERRKYSRGGQLPVKRRWLRAPLLLAPEAADGGAFRLIEDREQYNSAREYLCVRVGSWDEELVVSIFVGFDLRGNTLYSEFYPYVLPPVISSFHLVDRLPARLTPGLLLRVGWNVSAGVPITMIRAVARTAGGWARRARGMLSRRQRDLAGKVPVDDNGDLRLGRYAVELVDTGALTSVRELAAIPNYHVFFQQADKEKYVKIVERRLIQIVRDFLEEHNVDVAEHDARGSTILDNSTYNVNNSGNIGNVNQRGRQDVHSRSGGKDNG